MRRICLAGLFAFLLVTLLGVGCRGNEDPAPGLPEPGSVPGWRTVGDLQSFGQDNLYDLVNGQAESFFAYGFEKVVVRDYENEAGDTLRIEVWQLATAADAYGLFSVSRAGQPVGIGNDGDGDPGRRLDFWQDRYFVRIFAPRPLDDTILQDFAREASANLPEGGAPPRLLERLPAAGIVAQSQVFFHSELSIQDRLWLGGQNLLGLSPTTDAVLARYSSDEGAGMLLLVEYPDSAEAGRALRALEGSGIPDLVAVQQQATRLGVVFGQITESTAASWLQQSLSDR